MAAPPLLGLTTYREQASWGVWSQRADLLPADYAHSIAAAGGVPMLLPPARTDIEAARAALGRLDGLLVSGGADVDPERYAEAPHPRTTSWRPDRDAWELLLLDAADELGMPVLGVCRGMQLMAVQAGGALDQHTPDLVGHERHNPGGDGFGDIDVTVRQDSRLAALVGGSVSARCHHHQSVRSHPGYVAAATAADGTLEAMEATGDRFRLAVQWHPETVPDGGLFAGLVAAAAAYAAAQS